MFRDKVSDKGPLGLDVVKDCFSQTSRRVEDVGCDRVRREMYY